MPALPRCRIPSRSGAKLFWPTVRIRLLLLKQEALTWMLCVQQMAIIYPIVWPCFSHLGRSKVTMIYAYI